MGIRILQISDTHLFADAAGCFYGLNTENSFLATFKQIQSLPIPDICLLTGDLAQDHSAVTYQRLARHMLSLHCPTYWIPGNHDDPAIMAQALSATQLHSDKSILIQNWHIILLNSHKPNSAAGYLSDTELKFLDTQLKAHPHHHALVVLHHHPIPLGSRWLDTVCLDNGSDFLAIIDRYSHIRGVVFGHVHQESASERNGIPYLSVPSTGFQFLPKSEPFALDISAHPGYRLITLAENGSIDSHVERIKQLTGQVAPNAAGY